MEVNEPLVAQARVKLVSIQNGKTKPTRTDKTVRILHTKCEHNTGIDTTQEINLGNSSLLLDLVMKSFLSSALVV